MRHSSGSTRSQMSPMARQSASTVRASTLRKCALIWEKACSIGFKSGVGWQEQEPGTPLLQTLRGFLAFMRRQVVEDDDVTLRQGRRQLGLHIGLEDAPGHRPVNHPGCRQPIPAQACDEGLGQPMPEWRFCIQALASRRASTRPGHLGGRAGLIEKDEPMRLLLHARLAFGAPVLACLAHVGASLFAGPQRFV